MQCENDIIISMSEDPRERRRFERIPFREDIIIDGIMKCAAIDISEGGLYVCTVQHFEEQRVIDIELPLRGDTIRVKAQIQYCQPGIGIGVKFIDLDEGRKEKIRDFIGGGKSQPATSGEVKRKILLIEENDITGKYKKGLVDEGFAVVEAKHIVEAMKILREQTPDLVVLDLYMKKMDGFKVLAILKTNPKWKDLPVIVCSTSGTEDVVKKVIDAGADEFLNKMMTPASQLLDVVKTVLNRSGKIL
jgi:twitching motility two-component system response regulator PilH